MEGYLVTLNPSRQHEKEKVLFLGYRLRVYGLGLVAMGTWGRLTLTMSTLMLNSIVSNADYPTPSSGQMSKSEPLAGSHDAVASNGVQLHVKVLQVPKRSNGTLGPKRVPRKMLRVHLVCGLYIVPVAL